MGVLAQGDKRYRGFVILGGRILFRNFQGRDGLKLNVMERMSQDNSKGDPFPRDDAMWRALGEGGLDGYENVELERTDRLVFGVLSSVAGLRRGIVSRDFRREVAWGTLLGLAAAVAVVGLVAFFGVETGVNAEVNALASLAQVNGVDLGGGDQFLIAHLDELLETDVHALWLEAPTR